MYSPQQGPQTSSPPHTSINSGKRAQSVDRISETQSRDTSPLRHSSQIPEQTAASFLAYPVSRVAFSLYRRLTEDVSAYRKQSSLSNLPYNIETSNGDSGPIYVPHRTASPFTPPPLTRLTLRSHVSPKRQILSRGLAEEIRLLLPSRLQLSAEWTLIHSIETDGVSLTTLYERCAPYADGWHGFVLVVKDGTGGTFGAYLTDPPCPSPHYYGTGECFLWRATILPASSWMANLPLPPSADTSNLQRSTTILADPVTKQSGLHMSSPQVLATSASAALKPSSPTNENGSREDPNNSIRFKAFPYSGVNNYMIFCEQNYLSVGGGDGRYGLWLDSVLERGISSTCPTFGNEPLSEEGEKFEILGVEIWWVGH